MGAGTSSLSLFRGLGGTAGAALLPALLFAQAGPAIADRYEAADASPAFRYAAAQHPHDLAEAHHPDLNDTAFLARLDPALARPFLDGFGHALDQVMLTAGGIVALAFLILLGLKQVSLRTEPPASRVTAMRGRRLCRSGGGSVGVGIVVAPVPRGEGRHEDTDALGRSRGDGGGGRCAGRLRFRAGRWRWRGTG